MMNKETFRRRWDWYAATLLLGLVFTAAVRLSITDWTSALGFVELVAGLGAIVGLLLGRSRLSGSAVGWVALACTLVVIPWQVSQVIHGQNDIFGILAEEWGRLGLTFQDIWFNRPVYDPIFFVTLISSIYWSIGLHCGYRLLRGPNIVSILLPPTLPVLIVQYYDGYDPARIWLLAGYFLLVLLLIGRVHSVDSREAWRGARVFTGAESEFDLVRTQMVLVLVIVLLAWLLPTPSAALPAAARVWQAVNEPYQHFVDWINQTLDAARSRTGNGLQVYGNTLGLGLRASQGAKVVFQVSPSVISVGATQEDVPRFYWQMRVYDTYEQDTWGNAHQNWSRNSSSGDADLLVSHGLGGQVASFAFDWQGDASTLLVAPSLPLWSSLNGTIQYEDADPPNVDLTSWRVDPYLQKGVAYTTRALLLAPTVSMLRSAEAAPPLWVSKRYLQTPANLSEDLRALAQRLTVDEPTQYDKVSAVTDYLRSTIKYSPEIAPAPSGVDPIDWFLFTWKSGYCNYYATAEVLMLRSVGIPARMVVGYAQGQPEPDGRFTVRERDAHAWPQVYFSEIGWVDFEPTTSQVALVRPLGSISSGATPTPAGSQSAFEPVNNPTNLPSQKVIISYQSIAVWVIIFGMLAVVGYGLWLVNRKQTIWQRIPHFLYRFYQQRGLNIPGWLEKWERWSKLTSVERSFQAINQGLMWLGKPQPPHATPAERAEMLKSLLPVMAEEIETLKIEHENTLFSQNPGDSLKANHAAWIIRLQTLRTILRRFVGAKDE